MKKCDEQAINRDEQARGAKMEGKMRADFLDRRTGYAESERSGERLLQAARRVSAANQFTGGLGEWPGYEDGRLVPLEGQRPRLTHFSATGGAEIAFRRHC